MCSERSGRYGFKNLTDNHDPDHHQKFRQDRTRQLRLQGGAKEMSPV